MRAKLPCERSAEQKRNSIPPTRIEKATDMGPPPNGSVSRSALRSSSAGTHQCWVLAITTARQCQDKSVSLTQHPVTLNRTRTCSRLSLDALAALSGTLCSEGV